MADKLGNVEVNIAVSQEHVEEVERKIRTGMECGRGIINRLPYYFLPYQITISLIYFLIMWFNALSDGNGISLKYSPREIATGHHPKFKSYRKVVFGSYVEAHNYQNITNRINPRNQRCIAFRPTGNLQGTQTNSR